MSFGIAGLSNRDRERLHLSDSAKVGPRRSSIRLEDVAHEAGVGLATVSRALNQPTRVSARTRAHVLATAERLGYSGNMAAMNLRSGQSSIIMAVLPPPIDSGAFQMVMRGIDMELANSGFSMIIGSLRSSVTEDQRILRLANGGIVGGIIAVALDIRAHTNGHPALGSGLPCVSLLFDLSSHGVPSVVTNDREAIANLTRKLITAGRKRIAYLAGPLGNYHETERYKGFLEAMHAAGIFPTGRLEGNFTYASGEEAGKFFLAARDRPDAIICCNDRTAIGFMHHVTKAGVKVPEDVAVTGFDDIEAGQYCTPSLTTYQQPSVEIGVRGAKRIMRLISGAQLGKVAEVDTIPSTLIRRESF